MSELSLLDAARLPAIVNVASVPMLSPFRYAGGKTWLVPRVRQWLRAAGGRCRRLVEPFAGGAIVGLTAAFEGLVAKTVLVELDHEVAAVWHTILGPDVDALVRKVEGFTPTEDSVAAVLGTETSDLPSRAFATIVRNRVSRGGILAPGAGVMRNGENGKGLTSRWYPETLCRRIRAIAERRDAIDFIEGDGIGFMRNRANDPGTAFFIDPPYVKAGRRLYTHNAVDHAGLFTVAASLTGDFLMTYDDASEIRRLAALHGFDARTVPMKTTHHECKSELLIGRDLSWLTDV